MSFILREASELCDSGKHFFGMTPYFSEDGKHESIKDVKKDQKQFNIIFTSIYIYNTKDPINYKKNWGRKETLLCIKRSWTDNIKAIKVN